MKRSFVLAILLLFLIILLFNFNNYISSNYNTLAVVLSNTISIVVATTILLGNKKIETKVAWTIFVLFAPIIGFLFYMILGVEYNRFRKFDKKNKNDSEIERLTMREEGHHERLLKKLDNRKSLAELVYRFMKMPLSRKNRTEILNNGDEKFIRLFDELKKAKMFIHMEYFIIKDGNILSELTQILMNKAKEGVEVRLLYDDFGCVDLPKSVVQRLNESGVKTSCFNKIDFKLFRPSINYRNHRKIVIIDNKIGLLGGLNIGDEYAHMDEYYGFWRDTHLLIEGEVVNDLHQVFIKDWYHTTNELLIAEKYVAKHKFDFQKSIVQIVADGPDNKLDVMRGTIFKMINEAREKIWITTPYLILDKELINALRIAALSGLDVKIIIPGKPDKGKKIIYKATEAYLSELLQSGVKIYKYKDHFIHSKIILIDDDVASIGTVNLDYRSLDLHFEVTALLYQDPSVTKLIKYYEEDLEKCEEILWISWQVRTWRQKVSESIVRIFSPLL